MLRLVWHGLGHTARGRSQHASAGPEGPHGPGTVLGERGSLVNVDAPLPGRQPPFRDVWPFLKRIYDRFGISESEPVPPAPSVGAVPEVAPQGTP